IDRAHAGDVSGDHQAAPLDRGKGLVGRLLVDFRNYHLRPFAGETLRDRAPHAEPGPRYYRDFVFELHGSPLLLAIAGIPAQSTRMNKANRTSIDCARVSWWQWALASWSPSALGCVSESGLGFWTGFWSASW